MDVVVCRLSIREACRQVQLPCDDARCLNMRLPARRSIGFARWLTAKLSALVDLLLVSAVLVGKSVYRIFDGVTDERQNLDVFFE